MKNRRKKLMNKGITGLTLSASLLALSFDAQAQQPPKVPRIGYLSANSLSSTPELVEAFQSEVSEQERNADGR
jgi:hypothetical protein